MDILTSESDLEAVNQNRANPYFQGGMPALSAMEGDRGDRATGAIAGPLICPLLSGPISILEMAAKEEWNGKEAQT